jgi:hypothetical protein
VLWNMVQYLRVRGGGIFLLCVGCGGCVMVVWWVEEEFSNTLRQDLTLLSPIGYSIDANGQTGCAP